MTVDAISHHFSAGVYAKEMHLKSGYYAKSHKHNYDHLSILASGHVVVECNGNRSEYVAPACIEIKAGIEHEIHAFADSVFYCIHATSETDVDKVDEVLIEKE